MSHCVDGGPAKVLLERGVGGTVLVWVVEPLDIGIAQDVSRALCRSIGLGQEACLMTACEVSEKGGALLGSETGGLLVLSPRGAQVQVDAVDLLSAPRRRDTDSLSGD